MIFELYECIYLFNSSIKKWKEVFSIRKQGWQEGGGQRNRAEVTVLVGGTGAVKGKHRAWAISSHGKHCSGTTTDVLESKPEKTQRGGHTVTKLRW